eukprot:Nk52_evm37s232 gene=Nk52_evmTU37s232
MAAMFFCTFKNGPLIKYPQYVLLGIAVGGCLLLLLSLNDSRSSSSPSLTSSFASSTSSCPMSRRDSLGKFCVPDAQWKTKKEIAQRQRTLNYYPPREFLYRDAFDFYQAAWEPEMACAEEMRIGVVGDGGKWMCDPGRLLGGNENCIIYSMGSNNEFSFEASMHYLYPNCEIHTFDHTVSNPDIPSYVKYHHWGVSGTDGETVIDHATRRVALVDGNAYTIPTIQKALKHTGRTIQVLKIDIEGSEYSAFAPYFKDVNSPKTPVLNFEQIQIELHTQRSISSFKETHKLIEDFTVKGNYVITHKEPNIQNVGRCCIEYAFVKMAPSFVDNKFISGGPSSVDEFKPKSRFTESAIPKFELESLLNAGVKP